jgi:hypothetical protein
MASRRARGSAERGGDDLEMGSGTMGRGRGQIAPHAYILSFCTRFRFVPVYGKHPFRKWTPRKKLTNQKLTSRRITCCPVPLVHSPGITMFVLVYVDDIIVTSSLDYAISALFPDLNGKFTIKDSCDLHYFLGIEVKSKIVCS